MVVALAADHVLPPSAEKDSQKTLRVVRMSIHTRPSAQLPAQQSREAERVATAAGR